jgi:hypothetical protein
MPDIHCVIDFETAGTGDFPALLSIGARKFVLPPYEPLSVTTPLDDDRLHARHISTTEFYSPVALQSCVLLGATIDAGTFLWWLQQSQEARVAITQGQTEDPGPTDGPYAHGTRVNSVMFDLCCWLKDDPYPVKYMWSHGGSFDVRILAAYFKKCFLPYVPPAWDFRDERDTRTLFALFPEVRWPKVPVKHHALYDAQAEMQMICECHRRLAVLCANGIPLSPVDNQKEMV